MDLANTFLLCFICAGLTCLRSIISQRLRGWGCGLTRSALSTSRLDIAKQQASEREATGSVLSGSALPPQSQAPGSTPDSTLTNGINRCQLCFFQSNAFYTDDKTCGLSRAVCDSTACSVTGTASSSPSSSQGDSDRDSDVRSLPSSVEYSDDERSFLKPGRRHRTTLSTSVDSTRIKPAIRLSRSSSLSRAKSTGEQPAKTKNVTFDAKGVIICSPPTVEALSLLAAGTPPVPFVARVSCVSSCTKNDDSVPIADAEQHPVRSADSVTPSSQRHSGCTSPFGTEGTGYTISPLGTAPTASQRVHVSSGKVTAPPHSVAVTSPAWTAWGAIAEPGLLSTDRAHAVALCRAALGRQRVMAALGEAKFRFSHLGRNKLRDGGPPAAPGPFTPLKISSPAQSSSEAQGSDHGSVRKNSQAIRKRLPNLPLACGDVGILSVGYASCGISPHGASVAAEQAPLPGPQRSAMRGGTEVSSILDRHGVSTRDIGNEGGLIGIDIASRRCPLVTKELAAGVLPEPWKCLMAQDGVAGLHGLNFIALNNFTSAGRMRLAEVVAKHHLQFQHLVSWRQEKN